MELMRNMLVAVDAGHGGYDSGISHMGRAEKNDNLDLALQLQSELTAQGINTIMTRIDDSFVSLDERVRIANAAKADLFISLHRSSYTEQAESPNSVEGFIYLTAPEEPDGLAAIKILEELVKAGIGNSREVNREDYHVLKATTMPAVLLKISSSDSEAADIIYDENKHRYAMLIARGIMRYFGLARSESLVAESASPFPYTSFPSEVRDMPCPVLRAPLSPLMPPVMLPREMMHPSYVPPTTAESYPFGSACDIAGQGVLDVQRALNRRYGWRIAENGILERSVRSAVIMSVQTELNNHHNRGLIVDGKLDGDIAAAIPTIAPTSPNGFIFILQAVLTLNGYDPGPIDGMYGERTKMAVQMFQRDLGFMPTGIVEPEMLIAMF